MKKSAATLCKCYGVFAIASMIFFAATGFGWWSPLPTDEQGRITAGGFLRGILLVMFHFGGLFALVTPVAFSED